MAAVLALCANGGAQVARTANEEYQTAPLRRKAAAEMTHWIRPRIEHTAELVASFDLRGGQTVADVGTGVGYLLPYLVERVGPLGSVTAEDIFQDFVLRVDDRIHAAGWNNVHAVLGTERDPKLPGGLDAAILLDTYHHLNYPGDMLCHIGRSLKSGGRLIVIDYYRSRKHPGATDEQLREHIRADRDQVSKEVESYGFELLRQFDHLPHEYVLIFRKP